MKARGNKGHFTMEQLADFARKVGTENQRRAMEGHLGACKKCAKAADTWRRVSEAAHRLPALEPPDGAVRTAKALYSMRKPEKKSLLKTRVAELLFDSFRAPLPAGVRSSTMAPRQLLFGSGDYRVDLRIEPQDDVDLVSLLGQVLHTTDSSRNLGSVQVALIQGRKVLARSQTNQFGEFQLQCDLTPRLELRVTLPDSLVSIPLIEPARGGTKGHSYVFGVTGF
jgi:hypothetical protein